MDRERSLKPHGRFHDQCVRRDDALQTVEKRAGGAGEDTNAGFLSGRHESAPSEKTGERGWGCIWRGSLFNSPLLNGLTTLSQCTSAAYVLQRSREKEIFVFILSRAFEEMKYSTRTIRFNPFPRRIHHPSSRFLELLGSLYCSRFLSPSI